MQDAFKLAWRFGWALVGGLVGALAVATVVVTVAAAALYAGRWLWRRAERLYVDLAVWHLARRRSSRMD